MTWISVEDKPNPSKSGYYLTCDLKDKYIAYGAKCKVLRWSRYCKEFWPTEQITHWMPLPDPPAVL